MVPRLPFQEWEGFNARESAQQMTGASRAWPGLTLLTLADIKTAAWLVDNNHLTHLETVTFTTDMDTQSVNTEVQTIKRLAGTVFNKSDDRIFAVQGNLITTRTPEMFFLHIAYLSLSDRVKFLNFLCQIQIYLNVVTSQHPFILSFQSLMLESCLRVVYSSRIYNIWWRLGQLR